MVGSHSLIIYRYNKYSPQKVNIFTKVLEIKKKSTTFAAHYAKN